MKIDELKERFSYAGDFIHFLQFLRQRWYEKVPRHQRTYLEKQGIVVPSVFNPDRLAFMQDEWGRLIKEYQCDWGSWRWHVANRLTEENILLISELSSNYQPRFKELKDYFEDFSPSILPLSLAIGKEALARCMPEIGFIAKEDPYGIVREESTIFMEEFGEKVYLGSRKPGFKTILLVFSESADRVYCPMGCSHCYRPSRFKKRKWSLIKNDGTQEPLKFLSPIEHTRKLVEWWNNNSQLEDAYDLIMSGGEPLMLANGVIRKILQELEKAKHLRTLRLCTGTVFLGLPFRIDDELIRIFKDFEKATGRVVSFNVHLSHPANFSPEAVLAARKVRNAGFDILTQVPLEAGVNFWPDDLGKSITTLTELSRLTQFTLGRRPSKLLVDLQGSVPLELALRVYSAVHETHYESDITHPTTFAILCREGNLNLSHHSIYAIQRRIEPDKGIVTYKIPHPDPQIGSVNHTEKLIHGVNDL